MIRPTRSIFMLFMAGLFVAAAGLVGCAHAELREVAMYDDTGLPIQYKRLDQNPERDFRVHWRRAAYEHPGNIKYPEPEPETKFREEWGAPYWVRDFKDLSSQDVTEWLYPDPNLMAQFVAGQLVYQGTIDDYERILLRRGYADQAMIQRADPDMVVQVLIYTNLFGVRLEDFHFVNGKLSQSKEGS